MASEFICDRINCISSVFRRCLANPLNGCFILSSRLQRLHCTRLVKTLVDLVGVCLTLQAMISLYWIGRATVDKCLLDLRGYEKNHLCVEGLYLIALGTLGSPVNVLSLSWVDCSVP